MPVEGGWKNFAHLEELTEGDIQSYLMDQTIQRFADAAARDIGIPPASTRNGMWCWYEDGTLLYVADDTLEDGGWKIYSSPWFDYTPVWTNLVLNSGTLDSARFRYISGDVRVRGQVTFAADSEISGTVAQSLPSTLTSDSGWTGGTGLARDDSGDVFDTLTIGITPGVSAFSWVCATSGLPLGNVEPFAGTFGEAGDQLTWDFLVAVA